MRDDLLLYYERELTFLRQSGAEFAERYPKIANRLVLEPDKCDDPHVERLLEGFAFLAARVHLKIDDEFPEVTAALLSILYPHYLRPIPSMSIAEFHLDPEQGKLAGGYQVPRGTTLYSKPVGGVPCRFRTAYDLTLWPVNVTAADLRSPDRLQPPLKTTDAVAALRVELSCFNGLQFRALELDTLRFHLTGEGAQVNTLLELLSCNLARIVIRDPGNPKLPAVTLPPSALRPAGFSEEEALLPYPRRSFAGYRILQEYFSFPEKFFYLDLTGLRQVWQTGFSEKAEILFLLTPFELPDRRQQLEVAVTERTFRLNCTPIVNLFQQTAEPILLDHQRYEYPLVPDARRPQAVEVFSIDEVIGVDSNGGDSRHYEPFFSYRHATQADAKQTFWLAHRRASGKRNDEGTEMSLSLVDLSGRPIHPNVEALTIRTTCTNRDLPSRLPFGNELGDFEMDGGAIVRRIVALRKPTVPLRPPVGKAVMWRLISHLSLNYLSLVSEGRSALQEILKLYNFSNSTFSAKQIEGIAGLHGKPHFARVMGENGISFARGTRVEMTLDEEQFVGGGAYLFASVLEHFLAHYATLNSFSQLVARTRQRKEVLREWQPRAGNRILL